MLFEPKDMADGQKRVKTMDAQRFADLFNMYVTTDWDGDISAWVEKPHYDKKYKLWTFPGNEYSDDEYANVGIFVKYYTNDSENSLIIPRGEG